MFTQRTCRGVSERPNRPLRLLDEEADEDERKEDEL